MQRKKGSFIVLFLLIQFVLVQSVFPQQELQLLPIDPQVRYGRLSNGLTYYIRHNEQPVERADFYIAQNVGSILEEENQRGLAHFLEHMAFNGSQHFPGTGMDKYLESVGMRMGENLNAYTSFDETVYMIMNAPVNRDGIVDSCLLILHDWSGFLLLEDSAIEKERGVIREEWRTGQDAQARLWEQQFPKMFPNSRYASRIPIGSIDVINNFKPEELRAYYKKWYRPDQQAIIVVGDIDVDKVEKSVIRLFANVPSPADLAPRPAFDVPDSDKPLISIATDREASNIILYLFYKHDTMPRELKATVNGLVKDYVQAVCGTMMNERLGELLQEASSPFVYAEAGDGEFMVARTKEAWTVATMAKENEITSALTLMVTETERVKQFGFTASEYERARTSLLKQYESAYNERDKQRNSMYTREYVRHFTQGGYIPGIEVEYGLLSQIAPQIPVEEINQYIQQIIGDENIVIGLTGPDKADLRYPTEDELLQTYLAAKEIPVEAYTENVSDEPLIPNLPASGTIVKEEVDPLFGATVMTLSNGIKVVLKHTDFKQDEIRMTATSPGGSTLFGDEDIINLKAFNDVIDLGGLGNFPATELGKKLAGKQASCAVSLGLENENVNGTASPSDIETLFELIYLNFVAIRPDNEVFSSYVSRLRAQLGNLELNPMVAFSDSITRAVYMDNPRADRIRLNELDKINYPRILEMYNERMVDASDFVFTFVGNIDIEAIRPLILQYLATLPSDKRVDEPGDVRRVPAMRKGKYENHFVREMEVPKTSVLNLISGQMDYSLENKVGITMLKQILDLVYTEKIREDQGATYGVQVSSGISSFPRGQTTLQVYFDTDPSKWKEMDKIIRDELNRIAKEGPRLQDFQKTRDNMLKRFSENTQENAYWLNILDEYYYKGDDWFSTYEEILTGMTPGFIKNFTYSLLKQGNSISVVMDSK